MGMIGLVVVGNDTSNKNAIENYGFKLESSYKIGGDVKETFIKNEKK